QVTNTAFACFWLYKCVRGYREGYNREFRFWAANRTAGRRKICRGDRKIPVLWCSCLDSFGRMAQRDISCLVVLDEASVRGRHAGKWSEERREAHNASQPVHNGRRRTADGSPPLLRP